MTLTRIIGGCTAAVLLCSTAQAQITNGSFESGDFTGWTAVNCPLPFSPWEVDVLGYSAQGLWPIFGLFTGDPTDGTFAAFHGFDGSGPGEFLLWQETLINQPTLAVDLRAGYDLLTYGAVLDRTVSVVIEPVGGGAALQTDVLFTAVAGTNVGDTGNMAETVDLSAFSGQTVRVVFVWDIPEPNSGPAAFQIDNIRLEGAAGPNLSVLGTCGQIGSGLQASGMTANGNVGFAWAVNTGSFVIGGAACAGTTIGLINPNPIAVVSADSSGNAVVLPGNGIPSQGCGVVSCQALDISSCAVTNVLGL